MTIKKPKVLIVDDDFEQFLKPIWEEALASRGFDYDYTLNGKSGLLKLLGASDNPFDALITDLRMPGAINGIELLRQVDRMKIQLKAMHLFTSYTRNNNGPLTDEVWTRLEVQGVVVWHKSIGFDLEDILKKIEEQLQAHR